jgi:SAM-dependent methyltransferase
MDPKLYDEMLAMQSRHFWFKGRCQILRRLLNEALPPSPQTNILDLGCGCGQNISAFSADYRMEGLDYSDQAIEFCRTQGLTVHQGFLPDILPFNNRQFDACLFLDVLEHVDNDVATVQSARLLLKSQGLLMATVPAYPSLFSGRDRFHGHKRRYTHATFKSLFPENEWQIKKLTYFNTFLFPLSATWRLLLKAMGQDKAAPDLHIPPEPFNSLLTAIFSAEKYFLPYFSFPFGLSLLVIAEKREH